jgi:5-methylcytosine-specific restriction endonuclease McrA
MNGTILVAIVVVTLAVGLFVFRAIPGVRAFFAYRGQRLITCPETQKAAAVDVAAGEAAVGAFLSEPTLRLKECSRWPERQDCGQECLKQIEVNPQNCLVWNIVSQWYEGKQCVYCHKTFGELHHLDHAPALLSPGHKTVEWRELRPEQLPEVFSNHQPICWNCHVAETFRRLHPDLVVDRQPEPRRMM